MDYNDFIQLVRQRRSIRSLKSDPLPEGTVEKLIEAARWAMSGANSQPWEFIAVTNPELRKKVVDAYEASREHTRKLEATRQENLRHPGAMSEEPVGFREAPLIIVVCGDPRANEAPVLSAGVWGEGISVFDASLANSAQVIHLAAASMGLGTQWVTLGMFSEQPLQEILGIPYFFSLPLMIPVGYPATAPAKPYRRDVKEILHYNRYDASRFRSDDQVRQWIAELRVKAKPAYNV